MTEDIWIKRVEINNFQSHKDTKIDFIKGTNALVGSSNSGKSAVIRAIKWCLINEPNGTNFIKIGEDEATVKVFLSNNKVIERTRNRKTTNLYRLYEDEELIDEFTGFGSKVPPDIIDAHGIVPIADNVYFQFADQLEAPFMLSLKPKQRAEVLGDLEELSKIDRALSGTNDDIRIKGKEKKNLEKEEKVLIANREKLKLETERLSSKIDTLKLLKKGIEEKVAIREYLKQHKKRLNDILMGAKEIQEEITKSHRIVSQWPEDLEKRIEEYKLIANHLLRLKGIKSEFQSIEYMKEDKLKSLEEINNTIQGKIENYRNVHQRIERLKSIRQEVAEVANGYSETIANLDYQPLDADITKYKVFFSHLEQLRNINATAIETKENTDKASKYIDQLIEEFVQELHNEKLCPTCGQGTHTICSETLETII